MWHRGRQFYNRVRDSFPKKVWELKQECEMDKGSRMFQVEGITHTKALSSLRCNEAGGW